MNWEDFFKLYEVVFDKNIACFPDDFSKWSTQEQAHKAAMEVIRSYVEMETSP